MDAHDRKRIMTQRQKIIQMLIDAGADLLMESMEAFNIELPKLLDLAMSIKN